MWASTKVDITAAATNAMVKVEDPNRSGMNINWEASIANDPSMVFPVVAVG